MAKSVLDIIIRTVKQGGADKETVAGLANIKSGLMQAGAIAGSFVAAYYAVDKVLQATVGTFVDYAAQVREMSRLTGTSAEDTSRLIQMADDLTISYESLQKALWFAAKNGMDVNVNSLAALADQYVALGSASEKAEFLAKNFGKSGAEMGKMMELGSAGVKAMSASIEGNLILTEQGLKSAREYEMAIDSLSDSWYGFKVAAGNAITPSLVALLDKANAEIAEEGGNLIQAEKGWRMLLGPIGLVWNAIDLFGNKTEDSTAAIDDNESAVNSVRGAYDDWASEMGAAQNELDELNSVVGTTDFSGLLDMTLNLQKGFDDFNQKQLDINQAMAETQAAFAAGQMTGEEFGAKMGELNGQLAENAAAHEDWAKRTVFALVQTRLAASGGIDSQEFAFLISLGEQMGIIDQSTATMAQNVNSALGSWDLSKPEEYKGVLENIMSTSDAASSSVATSTASMSGSIQKIDTSNLVETYDTISDIKDIADEGPIDLKINITTTGSLPDIPGGGGTPSVKTFSTGEVNSLSGVPMGGATTNTSTTNKKTNIWYPTFHVTGGEVANILESLS